tara:strand:- start:157 stop:945 length:789 start_codon:yes stop_codon:yes gene_type:complete
MSLNNFFKSLFGSSETTEKKTDHGLSFSKNVGNTNAFCPYCEEKLDKMPTRKTKCPKCENYIYKRTRPYDEVDIIVREDQLDNIEEQWAIKNGSHDIYLKEKAREKRIRDGMRERFGKEPADYDVEFRVLNDQAVEAEFSGNWGFARNYRLNMAKNLEKRKSHELALRLYYHVCYLDINGPNNRRGMQSIHLDKHPYFTPKSGLLASGVIKKMKKLISKLEFDEEDCKHGFIEVNNPISKGSPTPIAPEKAWIELKKELFKD